MKRSSTVLIALALTLGGVACGDSGARTVVAEFADIGDLVTRSNVQQSDAVVGSVRDIDLVERAETWIAQVTLEVNESTRLVDGMRAVVRSTSLLGEKYVDIVAPSEGSPVDGNVLIPMSHTAKAPELEAVFSQLGAILQSGGLVDLATITTASAAILEGQEENVGRVLDGTAKLIGSLRSQKDALASALDDLAQASRTLEGRSSTLDRALDVSDDALAVIASQSSQISELVVQLDRLGAPLARLTKSYGADIDEQVAILNEVVPKVFEVRETLEAAVEKLPAFTKLFAEAVPGDHVQLDVFLEALPLGTPTSTPLTSASLRDLFMEVVE